MSRALLCPAQGSETALQAGAGPGGVYDDGLAEVEGAKHWVGDGGFHHMRSDADGARREEACRLEAERWPRQTKEMLISHTQLDDWRLVHGKGRAIQREGDSGALEISDDLLLREEDIVIHSVAHADAHDMPVVHTEIVRPIKEREDGEGAVFDWSA